VQVDALVFDTLVAAGRLEEAAAIAAGEFLTGFDDEWVLEARDEHRAKLAELLEQLASTAVAGGDLRAALQWTRRQASIDPFAEEPQRRLMERLTAAGDPAAAHTASCAVLDLGGAAPLGLWAELIGELCQDLAAPPPDAMWPPVLAPIAPDLERRLGREPARRISASPDLERARLFEAMVALLD
jgi:hypothetical protein